METPVKVTEAQGIQPEGDGGAARGALSKSDAQNTSEGAPRSLESQHGLKWEATLFGLEPRWIVEPNISGVEDLARQYLKVKEGSPCTVSFHAQGGFNKLYRVDADSTAVMRVALPVDPYRKTASEVATMNFVREKTTAPVPSVLAHDSSRKNPLRFEWILMDYMPGRALQQAWRKLPLTRMEALVRELAIYQSQLLRERFHAIGNLYQGRNGSFTIGAIVSMGFFWGQRSSSAKTPRGPFKNSHDWLSARLSLVHEDQDRILETCEDEDEIEDAERTKRIADRLVKILSRIFPADEEEETVIFHDDINRSNILVADSGDAVSAILDWECVSAFPLWRAYSFPSFLEGRIREVEPERCDYPLDSADEDQDQEGLDNEGANTLYWEHLEDYQRGQLRRVFLEEMSRLSPGWEQHHQQGALKRDLELAVLHCDGELTMKRVEQWLDSYTETEGAPHSLEEVLSR